MGTRIITALCFLSLCLTGRGFANDGAPRHRDNSANPLSSSPTPKGTIPIYAAAKIYFYDTEGKTGLVYYGDDTRLSGKLAFEDGVVHTIEGNTCPVITVGQTGIPFWWETNNPWTGKVRGWAKSRQVDFIDSFMLPAPGSEVGLRLNTQGEITGLMTMGIYASLVDRTDSPSPLVYNYMSYSAHSSVLTVVYLPGNVLSSTVGIESHFFDSNDLAGDFPGTYWGDYSGQPIYPSRAAFSTTIPYGPLLAALTFDGSTTAMITINGRSSTFFQVDLPFAPLPGSSLPSTREALQMMEPPAFIMTSTLDAALMGDSIDLTTDLDYYCDRNHDSVIDCTDYALYHQQLAARSSP